MLKSVWEEGTVDTVIPDLVGYCGLLAYGLIFGLGVVFCLIFACIFYRNKCKRLQNSFASYLKQLDEKNVRLAGEISRLREGLKSKKTSG